MNACMFSGCLCVCMWHWHTLTFSTDAIVLRRLSARNSNDRCLCSHSLPHFLFSFGITILFQKLHVYKQFMFTCNVHCTCFGISLSLSLCRKHGEDKMSINEQHTDFQAKWNRQWHNHHPFLPFISSRLTSSGDERKRHDMQRILQHMLAFPLCIDRFCTMEFNGET